MRFCFHDWARWSEPIDTVDDNFLADSCSKVQVRYCLKCNKAHVAKIKQPWNAWFTAAAIRARGQA
jgi:hypothetical protein